MSDIINSTAFVACFGIFCFMLFMVGALYYSHKDLHGSSSYLDHLPAMTKKREYVTFLQEDGKSISVRKDKVTAISEEENGTVIWLDQVPMLLKEDFSDVMDALMGKTSWRAYQPPVGSMFYSYQEERKGA